MTIWVYGDSNSVQWDAAKTPNPGIPWPSLYGARIAGQGASSSLLLSRAIGGMRMHYCRGQGPVPGTLWPAIEQYAIDDLTAAFRRGIPPTAVWLMAGTNDLDPVSTPDAEIPDLHESYVAFQRNLWRLWGLRLSVVSVLPMYPTGILDWNAWSVRESRRKALNQRLRTVFAPSGDFLDLDPSMTDGNGALLTQHQLGDGLHINAAGHATVANAIPQNWGNR